MGSPPTVLRQAVPRGPTLTSRSRWETHRGTSTLARSISSLATRRKWVWATSSSKTTRREGSAPWSSVGRREGVVMQIGGDAGRHGDGPHGPALPLQEEGPRAPTPAEHTEGVGAGWSGAGRRAGSTCWLARAGRAGPPPWTVISPVWKVRLRTSEPSRCAGCF